MNKSIKSNYHTHCTFCDGTVSAEQMVLAAIDKGFDILGFSSHSMYPFSDDWHIETTAHTDYCNEIRRLKEVYSGKIKIYTGFEADFISGWCSPDFSAYKAFAPDYLIGSVHFVPGKNGGYFEADSTNAADVQKRIEDYFYGNIREAVKSYFACERKMLETCDFSIIGHPDLIRMQNRYESQPMFDENTQWYKDEVEATAEAIAKAGVAVELNTGGLARGHMHSPYPSLFFLSRLKTKKVPLVLSSDAHRPEHLDYWFNEAALYAKAAGYTELAYFSDGLFFQRIN